METPIPAGLITALRTARHVTILTGAGVSAESGIPTFRDAMKGLWAHFSPEELATPEAFQRHPQLIWDWYVARRKDVQAALPNPGHLALVAMARHVPRLSLITQNVDGLHTRAGSSNVIELHGNIMRVRCSADGVIYTQWDEDAELPPACPDCGAPLRPDVVWFGELLPEDELIRAREATMQCDLFLSIGTSGQVEPAASLPRLAYNRGAVLAEINLDVEDYAKGRYYAIHARSGEFLPRLLAATWPEAYANR